MKICFALDQVFQEMFARSEESQNRAEAGARENRPSLLDDKISEKAEAAL